MYQQIDSLYVRGGCFQEARSAEPFCLENIVADTFNIVFGRNGSGKSTIAKCFQALADDTGNGAGPLYAQLNRKLTKEERQGICVFNEGYVERNIRVAQQGLHAIAMFGEQVAKADEQTALENRLNQIAADLDALNNQTQSLRDALERAKQNLESVLKQAGGYTQRGRDIKGQRIAIQVRMDDIERHRGRVTGLDPQKLRADIQSNIRRLDMARHVAPASWAAPTLPSLDLFAAADGLLKDKLQQVVLDDEVLTRLLAESTLNHYLRESRTLFVEKRMDYCPLCFRTVSPEYASELERRIAQVLDESAKRFTGQIDRLLEQCNEVSLTPMPVEPFKDECNAVSVAVNDLNVLMRAVRVALSNKREHLYEPSRGIDLKGATAKLKVCSDAVAALKAKITQQNQDVSQREQLQRNTLTKNEQLACIEHEARFQARDGAEQEFTDHQKRINTLETEKRDIQRKLAALASKPNPTVAMNIINRLLAMVFVGRDRLQLAGQEGLGYRILSRGQEVRPDAISTGERNVMALAYFFTSMLEQQSEGSGYRRPRLVVIDDPVSSFDHENRYGIIQLLTDRARCILHGHPDSRFLFLTHDLQTLNDLVCMRRTLHCDTRKDASGQRVKSNVAYSELYERELYASSTEKMDDYRSRMEQVFSFAVDENDFRDDTKGNQIRRLFETYTTFMYKKGLQEVLQNAHIMKPVPECWRKHFNSLPAALMLNAASHDPNYGDSPVSANAITSPERMRLTARSLFIFLFFTNQSHLYSCIGDDIHLVREWITTIEQDFNMPTSQSRCPDSDSGTPTATPEQSLEYYKHETFTLAYDGRCYHCGECKVNRTDRIDAYVGKAVRLFNVRVNQYNDRERYPYFAVLDYRHLPKEENVGKDRRVPLAR